MKILQCSAVAVALALIGCSHEVPPWHGDETFTSEERAAIEAGQAFTAAHVGREVTPIVWDAPHVDESAPCPDATICKRLTPPAGHCAWTSVDGRATIEVYEVSEALAAHEFGHWFGLTHHPEPGVMHASPVLEWTAADEAEVSR